VGLAAAIVLGSNALGRRISAAAAADGAAPAEITQSLLAELFIDTGPQSRLAIALQDHLDGDDAALFFRFQRVVWNAVRQELFHRWPENDPLSARLWRRLQRVIRDDDRIMAFPSDRAEWIAAAMLEPAAQLDLLDEIELRRIAAEVFHPTLRTADLVARVVTHPTCRNKAISIEALFGVLRECIPQGLALALEEEMSSPSPNPDYTLAVEKAVAAIRPGLPPVLDHYIRKGKLTEELAQGFSRALIDLATDWGEGEPAMDYHEYLHAHCPHITRDSYRAEYRAVFEYLAEKVKDWFFDEMRSYFADKKSAGLGHGS
jgi:hypothetical protein